MITVDRATVRELLENVSRNADASSGSAAGRTRRRRRQAEQDMDRTRMMQRRVRGLRVSTVLLLVAIVPLGGIIAVTAGSVREARNVSAQAAVTEDRTVQTVDTFRLRAAVFDELVWSAMISVVDQLGVEQQLVSDVVGTDMDAEMAIRQDAVDALLAELDLDDVERAITALRSSDIGMLATIDAYQGISQRIAEAARASLNNLSDESGESVDTSDLLAAMRVLRSAVDAQTASSEQFFGYFAAIFELRGTPTQEVSALISLNGQFDAAIAELRRSAGSSEMLDRAVEAYRTAPAMVDFRRTIDGFVAQGLADGLAPVGQDLSIEAVFADVDGFTAVYEAATRSAELGLAMLDAATDVALTEVESVREAADDQIQRAYLLAAALTVASLLAALVASRFIVTPLRRLQKAADSLREDTATSAADVGGPLEVRSAAQAIGDADAHFDLVTRQARALAAGDLEAPVLAEAVPGGLGTALHEAVGTLHGALATQEEFRRRLAHEAAHDGLTKLPNRNASMAQLARSLARTSRSGSHLAVLFVDLDRFKDVNDHHGHQAGDVVLTTIAQRLVTTVREGDHVGRLGGDEFVVIAEPVQGVEDAMSLADRVMDALREPIDIGSVKVDVGASIGVALADGSDLTADEVLRDADLAVYRAKANGRDSIEICNEDLRNEVAEAADLSVAIRQAIENDEFVMHYQPIVDSTTNELRALEALVRWARPGHDGLVPPDVFIAFAERSTLIVDLDRWVLDAVARQIAEWRTDPRWSGVPVAINVSGRHLTHDRFVHHVLEPLGAHAIEPTAIIIEVTESALLEDLATAGAKLQQLRDHGVLVSIDDFGTGYTSLAHLRSLPIDILKIDRSFTATAVNGPHEESIVKLIIDTGHLLGARITAEGVETACEADRMVDLGSDSLQGFFYARPQPADTILSLAESLSPVSPRPD
jgi:diguanylate cyclase (GGDEF)-like protein